MHRRRPKRRWLRWLLLLAVLDGAAFYWWWSNQAERRYNGIVREAAAEIGVEYALIKAVIWQESRFREDAVGDAGEIGLMQLMELAAFEWADDHGVRDF
ncbi:MAG: transglycosylase SLT domain-containing protein, partial [Verrucomicrobia bacterium]|nr:transglycosylase SLT domain-containing protein [Verrucomicrobiota bacterium]